MSSNSKTAKRKLKTESCQSSKTPRTRLRNESDQMENLSEYPWTGDPLSLPPEILLMVFSFVIETEGITNVLHRLTLVCKQWYTILNDPSLLKYLNFSNVMGEQVLQKLDILLSKRDISFCQYLNLAGQTKLSGGLIKKLLQYTPRLKTLDLRGCRRSFTIPSDMMEILPDLCPNLNRLDMSQVQVPFVSHIPYPITQGFFNSLGSKLVAFRLNHMYMAQSESTAKSLLNAISLNCPLLEELDLSRPRYYLRKFNDPLVFDFDMGQLAIGCPKLKELRLDGLLITDSDTTSNIPHRAYDPGFVNLKVFSQAGVICTHKSPAMYRMFSGNNLMELDISLSNLVPSEIIALQSVKTLYLSEMRWSNEAPFFFNTVSQSWLDSLEVLDLSNNKGDLVYNCLMRFFGVQPCKQITLKRLNLSNSSVSVDVVLYVLEHCDLLETINLTSCRELPRDCKGIFVRSEFPDLIVSLNTNSD